MELNITQEEPLQKYFSYKKIEMDSEGWADAQATKPRKYDLVTLNVNSIHGIRNINGWWTGASWQGLRLTPKHTVVKWQRKEKF